MDNASVMEMLDGVGYIDPDHPEYIEASKIAELPLPFLEFEFEAVDFFADGVAYMTWQRLEIRLYTDTQLRSETEHKLERRLRKSEISAKKKREFLPELGLWQTTYTMEV